MIKVLWNKYLLLSNFNVGESTINVSLASSISPIAIYTYYLVFIFLHYLMGLINPIREIGKAPEYMRVIRSLYGIRMSHPCAK